MRARVAGRLAARRGQGKAAFLDLVDRSGRIQLHARADVLGQESLDRLVSLDLGDLLGAEGTVFRTRRGELSLAIDSWTLLAKSLRAPPEKHHGLVGRRDPLPPARARPDGQRGGARAVHDARARDHRDAPLPRCGGVRRGRDPDPAADLRRRHGPAVRHAPQRARPHAVHADRHRALSQAPDRRRARARVRDRQGLPQRGRLLQAQPGVHAARVVRGVRGLPGRRCSLRGTGGLGRACGRRFRVRTPLEARDAGGRDLVAYRDRRVRAPRHCFIEGGDGGGRARSGGARGDVGSSRRPPAREVRRAYT